MRRLRALALVLTTVLLTSCGSDSGTNPTDNSLSGTFALQWVNDKALPFSIDDAGDVYTITSDRISFQRDGHFAESITVSLTAAGRTETATLSVTGTYAFSASTTAVSLLAADGSQITGTVQADTMQLHDGGDTFVFYRAQ